jgi:hypothetical protein
MSSVRSRTGEECSIVAGIIAGRPWTASTVKNPHLRKHARALGRTFRDARPVTDALREPCRRAFEALARHSHLLDRAHPLTGDLVPMLVRVSAYAAHWVRPPEDWQAPARSTPEAQWRDFLRHLFAAWPVPEFFDSAWQVRGDLWCLERDWFCHLGRGGSWRKAEGFPKSISRQAVHFALHAPAGLTVREALRHGQLAALGASAALEKEVLASAMTRDLSHDDFWSPLLAKVAAARGFDPREFGVVADVIAELLRHEHFNRARQLIELPFAELRRHAFRRWRGLLEAAKAEGVRFRDPDLTRAALRAELRHFSESGWEPMRDVGRFEIERSEGYEPPSLWLIQERLNHAQLTAEGEALRHCVAGYWRRCREGNSAIFSLLQFHPAVAHERIVPRLTIEVERSSRRVVQARGKWNRGPDATEYRVLEDWAKRNELRLAV